MSGDVEDKTSTLGGRVGKGINDGISWVLWTIFANVVHLLWWLTRWRRGEKLWKKLGLGFVNKYHKAAGGDRLGFVESPNGTVDLVPVKYVPAEQCDEDEQPGWRAKGVDKTWKPTDAGEAQLRLGSTPIVPLPSDSHRAATYAEARIAEAIDQGDDRPLYRVDSADLTATIDMAGGGGQAGAVADGGQVQNLTFDPRGSPIFEDILVEIGGDDYEGSAVSFRKVQEMYKESTTSEEMRKQETRGFIAGRSAKDWGATAVKIMLIALGIIAVVTLGPPLISNLFGGGGGGGGGGGIIPIAIGALVG
jgi:hypothetical protein